MKPNLVLMSHGKLASAFIDAAKIILGEIDNYDIIDMQPDDTFDTVEEKLRTILNKIQNNNILIITDLCGCTPFNIASKFYRKYSNISLISGMNLDMIIEYFASDVHDDINRLINDIMSVSKDSIILYSKTFNEIYDDIDM